MTIEQFVKRIVKEWTDPSPPLAFGYVVIGAFALLLMNHNSCIQGYETCVTVDSTVGKIALLGFGMGFFANEIINKLPLVKDFKKQKANEAGHDETQSLIN